jgi:hypothetical protein
MIRKRRPSFKPSLEALEDRCCPSGGGGSGIVPPGTIYYTDYKPLQSPLGWYDSFNNSDSMKADGTAKTVLANFPQYGEPSHLLHGARWILDGEPVPGVYPNGLQREELFATRLSDGVKVQLTNDPNVQPNFTGLRWAFADGFVSFPAVTWTAESTGGNFTDSSGQQWLVDAGIFKANVDWTTGSPVAATPTKALDAGLFFGSGGDFSSFWAKPDIVHFDWSPSGTQIVYDQGIEASPGNAVTDYLRLTAFDANGNPVNTIQLATSVNGANFLPEWAPDGSRIAYDNGYGIWTVKPDGTSAAQLTNLGTNGVGVYDGHPDWSPDSKQIAFTESTQTNKGGLTHYLEDVLRVAATGGTPVNLTKDVSDNTYVAAWRADVQALTAAAIGTGATQTLRSSQVEPLLAEALARWQAAGVDTTALGNVQVQIVNLGGTTLGMASGNTITLDDNAAGWGWFVDPTPANDSEFTTPGNQGEQGRMDLLTVLEHELGHLLGFDHQKTGVMEDTLATGTRETPTGQWTVQDLALVDLVFAGEQNPLRRKFF